MKLSGIFTLALLSPLFCRCSKKEPANPDVPPKSYGEVCHRKEGIFVDTVFINYIGTVKVPNDSMYVISYTPTSKIRTGFLRPCNLPEQFIKEGQKIKISGDVLSYPGFEKLDKYAESIYLTSVEAVNN